ncbi:MAG: universal stress protein [Acidovorax sp.]|nr:universal stress protein [Acidovorax sp.]
MKRQDRSVSTIVLATDFLRPAQRAFAYAIALAKALRCRLAIIHVIKGVADAQLPHPPEGRNLQSMKTSALLELGRLVRVAQDAGVRAEPFLRVGHPATCIRDRLLDGPLSLIVMGTHGRTGWDRLELGSTAESVIREAPCPVMVVRGLVAGDAVRGRTPVRLKRILVATDFSVCAQAAVRYAAMLARQLESELMVLHVVEALDRRPDFGRSGAKNVVEISVGQARSQRRLDRTLSLLKTDGVKTEGRCVTGVPIDVILAMAGEWTVDAIVVGTQGRRGLRRLMLGSLAEQVVRRAGCPVLTVNRSANHVRV